LSHSDEFLITGSQDRLINVIRIETGDLIHSIEKHFDSITALAISNDDTILVSGNRPIEKNLIYFSFSKYKLLFSLSNLGLFIYLSTFFSIASLDQTVKRWSFSDMQLVDTISTILSPVHSMVITCDNTFVVIG
jgi:WD40 repeat protein